MTDNKNIRGRADRLKVDINDPGEVETLHKKFPVLSHTTIRTAIKTAGPMRKDVLIYLKRLLHPRP
jgi:Protein of unknown function (DUF3606)